MSVEHKIYYSICQIDIDYFLQDQEDSNALKICFILTIYTKF